MSLWEPLERKKAVEAAFFRLSNYRLTKRTSSLPRTGRRALVMTFLGPHLAALVIVGVAASGVAGAARVTIDADGAVDAGTANACIDAGANASTAIRLCP